MDYALLVQAIQEGDDGTTNSMVSEATPILIRMLKVRMNASQEDAEDAVQMMFLYVVKAIRDDRIKSPSGLLSYMILTCRHSYLKSVDGFRPELSDGQLQEPAEEPVQLSDLIEEEKMLIYEECIRLLRNDKRKFFSYWMRHPDSRASEIAEYFKISVNNAWTRKHRIIKILQECIDSKF